MATAGGSFDSLSARTLLAGWAGAAPFNRASAAWLITEGNFSSYDGFNALSTIRIHGGCKLMSIVRRRGVLLFLVAFPLFATAQAKENVFDAPPEKVYAALQKVIADQYVIIFEDHQQTVVSFRTPETNTAAMEGSATVVAENGKARLRVHLQPVRDQTTIGKGGRIANSILKWVGEELDKTPESTRTPH